MPIVWSVPAWVRNVDESQAMPEGEAVWAMKNQQDTRMIGNAKRKTKSMYLIFISSLPDDPAVGWITGFAKMTSKPKGSPRRWAYPVLGDAGWNHQETFSVEWILRRNQLEYCCRGDFGSTGEFQTIKLAVALKAMWQRHKELKPLLQSLLPTKEEF